MPAEQKPIHEHRDNDAHTGVQHAVDDVHEAVVDVPVWPSQDAQHHDARNLNGRGQPDEVTYVYYQKNGERRN